MADRPDAKYLLVVGDGINYIDSSGEEVIHRLVEGLRDSDTQVVFSGLKRQVLDVLKATGLRDIIGNENIHATEEQAINSIYSRLGPEASDDLFCALPPEE